MELFAILTIPILIYLLIFYRYILRLVKDPNKTKIVLTKNVVFIIGSMLLFTVLTYVFNLGSVLIFILPFLYFGYAYRTIKDLDNQKEDKNSKQNKSGYMM